MRCAVRRSRQQRQTPRKAVDRVGDWIRSLAEQTGRPQRRTEVATASITVTFARPGGRFRAAELAATEQACRALIDADFGRILAAYSDIFVAGSLGWGMVGRSRRR